MSEIHTRKAMIGSEIPYRRSPMDRRTGSLVFDLHLDKTLAEAPGRTLGEQANPLKRGQVT